MAHSLDTSPALEAGDQPSVLTTPRLQWPMERISPRRSDDPRRENFGLESRHIDRRRSPVAAATIPRWELVAAESVIRQY